MNKIYGANNDSEEKLRVWKFGTHCDVEIT